MKRLRRIWRAIFCSEPVFLDGLYVSCRTRTVGFDQALREKADMNVRAKLDWYRGEKW